MKIERIIDGGLEANCYLVYEKDGGDAWIIDPGYSHKKYLSAIRSRKLSASAILLTHHHYDHSGAAKVLAVELGVHIMLHRSDMPWYDNDYVRPLEGGEVLVLPKTNISLKVLHTPGHSPGGLCYYAEKEKTAFTGDTVFNVDLGRTDLKGGSESDMSRSLHDVVDKWPNDVTIYPGHGDPATMKYVRAMNMEYREYIG